MAFFQNIKKLLGFGDEYEEEIGIDATVVPLNSRDNQTPNDDINREQNVGDKSPEQGLEPENVEVPMQEIFNGVIAIFNESLPDFLAKSMDPERQKARMLEAIDSDIKTFLKKAAEAESKRVGQKWSFERQKLMAEIDSFKQRSKKTEESENEWKTRQLSAERQKRALMERIHDLENTITRLEADREQFELENKSLLNKIRVTSVQEGDFDSLREENLELRSQLEDALKNQASPANAANEDELKARIEELEKQNAALESNIGEMEKKMEISDAMNRDFNSIASSSKKEIKETQQKLEECMAELAATKQQLVEANEANENLRAELETANENLTIVEEIQQQLDKFEEIKANKNAKISELQAARTSLIERNRILEDEIIGLKRNIEHNSQAEAEKIGQLQAEINSLREKNSEIVEAANLSTVEDAFVPIGYPTENRRTRKAKQEKEKTKPAESTEDNKTEWVETKVEPKEKQPVKISAIDSTLDNTDWLIATPPEGTSTRDAIKEAIKSDSDEQFGYQAPPIKKTPPENEAQMTLW